MACNNSARRQWRKQEAVVGAAASKMRVQVHEADAGSRNPYSLAWVLPAGPDARFVKNLGSFWKQALEKLFC